MATQTIEFAAATGETITAKLYAAGSDTVAATASSVTEQTNRKGVYYASVTSSLAGVYRLVATDASNTPLATWWVTLADANGTYIAYETPDAGSITAARMAALDSVLIAANANQRTVHVTGSQHVAAVLHDAEANSIPAGALTTEAITAIQSGLATSAALATVQADTDDIQSRLPAALVSGRMDSHTGAMGVDTVTSAALAADAVTEIQSGLATAANQAIIIDRVSYSLTALVGACSDAGTAAETYTLSIGGDTFTVDHAGLDATGNRGTVTLSKV